MSCADDGDNAEEDNSEEWVRRWSFETLNGQHGELLYIEIYSGLTQLNAQSLRSDPDFIGGVFDL